MRRYKNCAKIEGRKAYLIAHHQVVKQEKYREKEWRKLLLQLFIDKAKAHHRYIVFTAFVVAASLLAGCLFIYAFYRWCLWFGRI